MVVVSKTNSGPSFSGKKDSWLRLQREVCGMHVFVYQLVFSCAGSQRVHIGGGKSAAECKASNNKMLDPFGFAFTVLKSQSGTATAVATGIKECYLIAMLSFVCPPPPAEDQT